MDILLAASVTLAVLVVFPAAPSGGTHVCANGTAVEGFADSVGQTRCASCNLLYRPDGTASVIGTSCQPVTLGGHPHRHRSQLWRGQRLAI